MRKYIFSNIKFKIDWRLVFIILGVGICIFSYNACKIRSDYCNIFYKDGPLAEYKVLSKKKHDRYDNTGSIVIQSVKTGEIFTKEYNGYDDYLIFESIQVGQTLNIKTKYEKTLTSQERNKLWKGSEPIECTWLFPLLYGFAMLLFGIFLDDCDEDDLWLRVFGGVFMIVGAIFAIFI